jgi:glycine oxidase
MKVIIVGAGSAGLGIGWRLAQAGATVTVIDRAQPGRGATWAAAGMIAVAGETGGSGDAEAELSRQSSMLWPEFAKELEEASGTKVDYAQSGALMVQLRGEDSSWLPAGELVEAVDAAAVSRIEPTLTGEWERVLWAPREAQVDNRALGIALARAFASAGGELVLNETVVRFQIRSERVVSAETPFRRYEADAFIIAAGAWSGLIDGLPSAVRPPVKPLKGEMIALEGAAFPSHVIRGSNVYLVPRGDRLFVGATVEDCGFDTQVTREAAKTLFERARQLVPGLVRAEIVEHWAGLRPGTPDGLPILGQTAIAGLYAASGQFRNGILFAPAISDMLCGLLLGREEVPLAFDPRRFGSSNPIGAEGQAQ